MRGSLRAVLALICALFSTAIGTATAEAADKLKLAIGQRGIWHGATADLGQRAGIFRKHDLELEILYTEGAGQTMQAVISNSADVGVSVGTLGVFGAYAKGAPLRIIGSESIGEDSYWFVKPDSPIQTMRDMAGKTMGYSTTGSSTHAAALALIDMFKVDAKPVATGGFPATFTQVMSGQIDAGWSAPPYAMQALRKGDIRIIVRTAELPLVRDHSIRVLVGNAQGLAAKPELFKRFMRAYRETVDWMYASDDALKMYAEFVPIPFEDAKRIREEFDPKEMLIPDRVAGLADLMPDAVKFKFIAQSLTDAQLAELVQLPK
jgi:NitT/TauT family transport system substrate-binding protein